MSPQIGGYSLYVAPLRGQGWMVRVYRDSDDTHIHSTEGGAPLSVCLKEAEEAIFVDSVKGQR